MRLSVKPLAIAGVATVTALSVSGLSPTMAAEPDGVDNSTTAETAAPAETEDTVTPEEAPATTSATPPAEDESGEPETSDTTAPEATEESTEPEATGLIDLTVQDKTTSIPLPIPGLTLPLDLGSLNLSPQSAPATEDPQFGGFASGIYAEALASDEIRVKIGQLGAISMSPDGAPTSNSAARVYLPTLHLPVLIAIPIVGIHAEGITVGTEGRFSYPDNRPRAVAATEVEDFSGQFYSANLTARGIHVRANVERLADGQYKLTGATQFAYLSFYGLVNWEDKPIEPNRTLEVPSLGTVVLNEQKITQLPGNRHGIRVTAIHITLGTAKFGLPAGADIYIGNAEAIVYE